MNVAPIVWRPLGELDLTLAAERTRLALEGWSRTWFDHRPFSLENGEVYAPRRRILDKTITWYQSDHVSVGLAGEGESLVGLALDLSNRRPRMTAQDESILQRFEAEMVEELLRSITERLAAPDGHKIQRSTEATPENLHGGLIFQVQDAEQRCLAYIFLQFIALTGLRRLTPSPRTLTALTDRIELLDQAHVLLEPRLGHAEVQVKDLLQLSVGDVVVLDQKLTDPIELVASNDGSSVGVGHLFRANKNLVFQIQNR